MEALRRIATYFKLKRSSAAAFNIFQFLFIYALLSVWFYGYVGITSPGGKVYSSFLDHYLNIPSWFTWLISKAALALLKLMGFTAYQRAPNNVTIVGSRGVTILWACLGFGVMSCWIAFVTAHKAAWQYKFKWCTLGVIIITALNIARITLIAVANHYHWLAITSLEPHEAFNITSYIFLFLLAVWFIARYRRYEKKYFPVYSKKPVTVPSSSQPSNS